MSNQNKTISWQAPEFRHYPKSLGWYASVVAISILIIGFFVIIESDLFAAISLGVIALIAIIFARQHPKMVEVEIGPKGVKFGNLFYPYKQLKFFWVVQNDRHSTVNFYTSALVNNTLILEMEEQDGDEIRDLLVKYIPEHPQTQETLAQRIMHRLKF